MGRLVSLALLALPLLSRLLARRRRVHRRLLLSPLLPLRLVLAARAPAVLPRRVEAGADAAPRDVALVAARRRGLLEADGAVVR